MSTRDLTREMQAIMALADALGHEILVKIGDTETLLDDTIENRENSAKEYEFIAQEKR